MLTLKSSPRGALARRLALLALTGASPLALAQPAPTAEATEAPAAEATEVPAAEATEAPAAPSGPFEAELRAEAISPDRLVALALARHPRLESARAQIDAAAFTVDSQGYWPWPQLEIALSHMADASGRRPIFQRLSVMQDLPWSAQLEAQKDSAKAQGRATRARLRLTLLDIALKVRLATAQRLRLDAEHALVLRQIETWKQREITLQDRLAVGSGDASSILLAQVERARLENEAHDLRQLSTVAQARLNLWLSRPTDAPLPRIEAPSQMPPDAVDELIEWVKKNHPSLSVAAAEIASARAAQASASVKARPQFSVGVDVQLMSMGDNAMHVSPTQPGVMLMAGSSLPLWTGSVRAEERAAKAAQAAAEAAQTDEIRELSFAVIEQHVAVESALRRLALYDDQIIPLAEQSLAAVEAAFAADRSPFTALLDAQRTLERLEHERIEAEAQLAEALATLRFTVGRPDRPAKPPVEAP